jgi:5'-3' exonuclease
LGLKKLSLFKIYFFHFLLFKPSIKTNKGVNVVIVDFSHLAMRNLYIAIGQVKPKKINGKYDMTQVIPFWFHLMLNSLRHISKKFGKDDSIVLAIDGRKNWRKEIYSEYKAHRQNERDKQAVDFDIFFEKMNSFIKLLDTCFPFYVIHSERAEADDVIGVLSKEYSKQGKKVIVISSDKDMKQVLLYPGVEIYDPINQKFVKMSYKEVREWKLLHILIGDKSDNVSSVMKGLEYDKDFVKFLKENNIFIYEPEKLEKMQIFEKLKNDYIAQTGKDIYKKTRFGEKTALKFIRENHLDEYLKNEKFRANFERNRKLMDFDYIPDDVRNEILELDKNKVMNYNEDCIFKFIMKFNLQEQLRNISDFTLIYQNHKNT